MMSTPYDPIADDTLDNRGWEGLDNKPAPNKAQHSDNYALTNITADNEREQHLIAEICGLRAHADKLAEALRELSRLVHQNNALQHAGLEVSPEAWSEMYQATSEAQAELSAYEKDSQ